MNKITKHIKNNFAIYLIIIACIVIVAITIYVNRHPKPTKVDTKYYDVVDINRALTLFNDDTPKLLIISTDDCSATAEYTKTLNYAMIQYDFKVYYLSLTNIDKSSPKYQEFIAKLDMDYYMKEGDIHPFNYFIGATPMNVIIKNKKMVYGYIGTMSLSALTTLTENYGVSHGQKN